MTTTALPSPANPPASSGAASEVLSRPPKTPRGATFKAMLLRDLTVLDRSLSEFLPSTIIQPFMLVFIFTYVFPTIGMAVGGSQGATQFSTLLLGGIVAQAIIFQGIFRVALPIAREFDTTNELEDRVLAPTSVTTIAVEKLLAGAIQGLFAGLVVFPVGAFLPATPLYLQANWPVLLTITPLACLASAALGLTLATWVEARRIAVICNFLAMPLSFLGAIFYTWDSLTPALWLKILVLANPLVYMSEGFRAGLAVGVPHMPLVSIYAVLGAYSVILTYTGIKGFNRRVVS